MKKVPKCKECNYYKSEPVSIGCMDSHWCMKVLILNSFGNYKYIYARELKTSPKWCPLRIVTSK